MTRPTFDDAGKELMDERTLCICGDELSEHNENGRCMNAYCECGEFREREPEIGEERE